MNFNKVCKPSIFSRELVEFNGDHATGEVLNVVAHKLCSLQADEKCSDVCAKIPNLAAQMHELARHATCLCSQGNFHHTA